LVCKEEDGREKKRNVKERDRSHPHEVIRIQEGAYMERRDERGVVDRAHHGQWNLAIQEGLLGKRKGRGSEWKERKRKGRRRGCIWDINSGSPWSC
jgi:hypothetical protein